MSYKRFATTATAPASETTQKSFPFEAVETEVKYAGFIKRQSDQVKRVAGKMNKGSRRGIDYASVTTLRMEAREKLAKMAPTTAGLRAESNPGGSPRRTSRASGARRGGRAQKGELRREEQAGGGA